MKSLKRTREQGEHVAKAAAPTTPKQRPTLSRPYRVEAPSYQKAKIRWAQQEVEERWRRIEARTHEQEELPEQSDNQKKIRLPKSHSPWAQEVKARWRRIEARMQEQEESADADDAALLVQRTTTILSHFTVWQASQAGGPIGKEH